MAGRLMRMRTESFHEDANWSTLLGRMFEDLSRVFQLEVRLLEAKLIPALSEVAERAIAASVVLGAGMMSGTCLLASLIFLLHKRLDWWVCFAAGGFVALAFAFGAYIITMKRSSVLVETGVEHLSKPDS
jgi:hypothetical protein